MAERPYYRSRGETPEGYVRKGDRAQGYVSRGELPSGYQRATGRINARQNLDTIKGMSGLNGYDALQDRRTLAFPKKGFEGQSASEIGERLNAHGARLRNGQIVSQRQSIMGGGNRSEARRSGDMMPSFPQKGSGGGAMGAAARTAGRVMNAAGGEINKAMGGRETMPDRMPSPTANPRGPMPTAADTAARAQEMRDERSMANDMRNEVSRTRDSSGRVTDMSSKHGSGSVEFLNPQQQANRQPGMVKDDFGRVKPIREEISRMNENRASKGIGPQGQPMNPQGGQMAGQPGMAAPSGSMAAASKGPVVAPGGVRPKDPAGGLAPGAAAGGGAAGGMAGAGAAGAGEKGAIAGGPKAAASGGPSADELMEAAAQFLVKPDDKKKKV